MTTTQFLLIIGVIYIAPHLPAFGSILFGCVFYYLCIMHCIGVYMTKPQMALEAFEYASTGNRRPKIINEALAREHAMRDAKTKCWVGVRAASRAGGVDVSTRRNRAHELCE